ncbi:MAG: MBOAT family protein, partial [Lachnospiraceae bacterium]|nr:MBOAT family protein [Lachnospiraceae bacterium]
MSIVSIQFLLFLAILTAVYFIVPKKGQWIVLLLGSYFFYIAVGGIGGFLFIMLSSLSVYGTARIVYGMENPRAKK